MKSQHKQYSWVQSKKIIKVVGNNIWASSQVKWQLWWHLLHMIILDHMSLQQEGQTLHMKCIRAFAIEGHKARDLVILKRMIGNKLGSKKFASMHFIWSFNPTNFQEWWSFLWGCSHKYYQAYIKEQGGCVKKTNHSTKRNIQRDHAAGRWHNKL